MAASEEIIGRREHFGSGALKPVPAKSVFINCPFDAEFQELFDAIVFTTVCCGFLPRSALESGGVSDSRMQRITSIMFSSKYSIHDLSRSRGEGAENFARFNMPLELGIAMAVRFVAATAELQHDWLLLVPEGHGYVRFLSDLAGFDPKIHNGTVESIVPKVTSWLATRPEAIQAPTPKQILKAFPSFQAERARLSEEWRGDVPWADIVLAAIKCVPRL
jgi:hypothetical protein